MTAVARKPRCCKCGGSVYSDLTHPTREICSACGYVQGEGAYLAAELLPVERAVEDVLDCGTPLETFEALVAHMERRKAAAREIANKLRRDANDAMEQAERHDAEANGFDQLIFAMRQAPITFPAASEMNSRHRDVNP